MAQKRSSDAPINECSKQGCHEHIWFTKEKLCRVHGIKDGVHLPKKVDPTLDEDYPIRIPQEHKPEEA